MPIVYWLFGSFSIYLLLAGIFIYFKRRLMQTVLIPLLLFYGIGGFLTLPFEGEFAFGLIASGLMVIMVCYILLSQLARLRVLRTFLALLLGIIFFMAVQYANYTVVEDSDTILQIQETERSLFSKQI